MDNQESIKLRPATSGDEPFLRDLYADTRREELALLPWDELQKKLFLDMQFDAQRRHYSMSYPHAASDIITANDRAIGRLLVDYEGPVITLIDIAVLSSARNRGVGTLLLNGLLRKARESGKSVYLHVTVANPAKHLYQRLGFAETSSDQVYSEMVWTAVGDNSAQERPL